MRPYSMNRAIGKRRGAQSAHTGHLDETLFYAAPQPLPAASAPAPQTYLRRAPDEYQPHPGEMTRRDTYHTEFPDEVRGAVPHPHEPVWLRGDPIRGVADFEPRRPSYWASPMTKELFADLLEQTALESAAALATPEPFNPGELFNPSDAELPHTLVEAAPLPDLEGRLDLPIASEEYGETPWALEPLALLVPETELVAADAIDQLVTRFAPALPEQPPIAPNQMLY